MGKHVFEFDFYIDKDANKQKTTVHRKDLDRIKL